MKILETESEASAAVHPLRNFEFLFLWIGTIISLLGDQLFLVGLPWLIFQITGSAVALAGILMTSAIPRSIFMLMGGIATDKISAKRVLIITAILRGVSVATIAMLIARQQLHLWHIYGIAAVFGIADAFAQPAQLALLPSIFDAEQLPAANALMQGSSLVCSLVGVAFAGLVIKACGMALSFALDTLTFLFVIASLWRLRTSTRSLIQDEPKGTWHQVSEGIRYVMKDPPLRALMLLVGAMNFGIAGPLVIGITVLAKERFSSTTAYSSMLSAVGIGTLIGVIVAGCVKYQRYRGMVLLTFFWMLGVVMVAMGFVTKLVVILCFLTFIGIGSGIVTIYLQSWYQARVEPRLLGRVLSVFLFVGSGLLPFSFALAGFLVQINLVTMFLSAGLLILLLTLVASLNRSVRTLN
jgi:hypothetical protein